MEKYLMYSGASAESPLTQRDGDSYSAYINAAISGFTIQLSHVNWDYDLQKGSNLLVDLNASTVTLEYDLFRSNEKLSLRPGFDYQTSTFDDREADVSFLGQKRILWNSAFSLRGDYSVNEKLRFIAATRLDSYNDPDDDYFSYQFAGTYEISDQQLVRAVVSRAFRGSTMTSMYTNSVTAGSVVSGNPNLKLQQVDLYEFGWRGTFGGKFQTNLELFYSEASDFFETMLVTEPSADPRFIFSYENYPLVAKQLGATMELTILPTDNFRFTAFGTFQQTDLEDAQRLTSPPTNPFLISYEQYDGENERTPSVFGGAKLFWTPTQKMSISSNLYYYGENALIITDQIALDVLGGLDNQAEVEAKARVDLKVSYNAFGSSKVFFNARNVFNNERSEFGWTDEIGGLYLIGLDLNF